MAEKNSGNGKKANIVAKNVTVNTNSDSSSKSTSKSDSITTSSSQKTNTEEKKIDTTPSQPKVDLSSVISEIKKINSNLEKATDSIASLNTIDDKMHDDFEKIYNEQKNTNEQLKEKDKNKESNSEKAEKSKPSQEEREATNELTRALKDYDKFLEKQREKKENSSVLSDSASALYKAGSSAEGLRGGMKMSAVGMASAINPALGAFTQFMLGDQMKGFTSSLFGSAKKKITETLADSKKETELQNHIIELMNENVANLEEVAKNTTRLKNTSLEQFQQIQNQAKEKPKSNEEGLFGGSVKADKEEGKRVSSVLSDNPSTTTNGNVNNIIKHIDDVKSAVNNNSETSEKNQNVINKTMSDVAKNTQKEQKTKSEQAQISENERKLFGLGKAQEEKPKVKSDLAAEFFKHLKQTLIAGAGALFIYLSSDQFKTWLLDKITHPFKKISQNFMDIFTGDNKMDALKNVISGIGELGVVVGVGVLAFRQLLGPLNLIFDIFKALPKIASGFGSMLKLGISAAKLGAKGAGLAAMAYRGYKAFDNIKKGNYADASKDIIKGGLSAAATAITGNPALGAAFGESVGFVGELVGNEMGDAFGSLATGVRRWWNKDKNEKNQERVKSIAKVSEFGYSPLEVLELEKTHGSLEKALEFAQANPKVQADSVEEAPEQKIETPIQSLETPKETKNSSVQVNTHNGETAETKRFNRLMSMKNSSDPLDRLVADGVLDYIKQIASNTAGKQAVAIEGSHMSSTLVPVKR